MVRRYQGLSPAQVDEIWVRSRAGHGPKPTARTLGLPTSTVRTYLLRCGGIRPGPRHRTAGRLRFEEREEISRDWEPSRWRRGQGFEPSLRKRNDCVVETLYACRFRRLGGFSPCAAGVRLSGGR